MCVSFCTFWPPWVRPCDNYGKCTWMERGFNASQTHCCIYPSIFNRLRAIARYWSVIATFSYPLHLMPPLGVFPLEFWEKCGRQKTRIMGLPGSEDSLTIGWAVSTLYQRVTDGQTDVQPISITCAVWLMHIKNKSTITSDTWLKHQGRYHFHKAFGWHLSHEILQVTVSTITSITYVVLISGWQHCRMVNAGDSICGMSLYDLVIVSGPDNRFLSLWWLRVITD